MDIVDEFFGSVRILRPFVSNDLRGRFVKPYQSSVLSSLEIKMVIREEFFSISSKGVVRGMHFQIPPHDHQKLVYCISGTILDVVLDLRKSSPTFGQHRSIELSDKNRNVIFIPKGFAHGFMSLSEGSCVVYKTDYEHVSESDSGILWNTFGFEWPDIVEEVQLSERDREHPSFVNYETPFS